ncbi:aldo/keto reductase [Pedobacter sp. SYSU D00535]|uniref:aldo/keto reductase n=1 Tax=Pedobacter sp. SYSU D00535 TaxID=2810308 RepID=UPI001A97BF34|nr:aldo/keto reductase [Pedobacter sp. SYSU D00535]
MEYTHLGKSDIKVGKISFGCMSLTGSLEEARRVLLRAVDLGVNYFDTADLYENGANEAKLGKCLEPYRDKLIIATKVGNQVRADGKGWDWNPRKEYILRAVEQSLRRLKTDYIDLYQLHGGTMEDPIDETVEAFELLKQQGKIRFYGISSIRPTVIREYVQRSNIVSVMTQYSLLDRRPEEATLDLLKQNEVGVMVRGAVAQGLLINKPAKQYLDRSEGEVRAAAELIKHLSQSRTNTQTALLYTLANPAVTSVVVGMRTLEQLEEVVGAMNAAPLTGEELELLQKGVRRNYYADHR